MSELSVDARRALLIALIRAMRRAESRTDETHIQKCVYFLNHLMGVSTGHPFVLYKHGPYSFELHDELTAMRIRLLLELVPRAPYGPSFVLGPFAERLHQRFSRTISANMVALEFVAKRLAPSDIGDLERLATALYVKTRNPDAKPDQLAKILVNLKPHIPPPLATAAVEEINSLQLSPAVGQG